MSLGRQEAFEIFKRDYVDSITIEDNKQLLKKRFAEAKSLGEKVNEVRNKISNYKTMFNRLKGLKIEIEHLQLLMEKAKVKLQKDFEVWWSEEASNLQVSECLLQFYANIKLKLISAPCPCNPENNRQRESSFPNFKNSSSSIPLTGDSQTDADILAFIKARQNFLGCGLYPLSLVPGGVGEENCLMHFSS
uniref:Kinesin-like protein KIF6/9 C-terminal domain-containing protein n=1 Tax=Chelonoidis abingdonii TaxID=106734 RepID=A0A8C0GWG1_CHEAB